MALVPCFLKSFYSECSTEPLVSSFVACGSRPSETSTKVINKEFSFLKITFGYNYGIELFHQGIQPNRFA